MNTAWSRAKRATWRAAGRILDPVYSGVGTILLLHRIVEHEGEERVGWPSHFETSVSELDAILSLFRRRAYSFVSLDELCEVLAKPRTRAASKLAVVTFDDGYVDNHKLAYPLLSMHGIPFTIYVATCFPDRSLVPWWYALEDHLLTRDELAFEHEGRSYRWSVQAHDSRVAAFTAAASIFETLSVDDARVLAIEAFGRDKIDELASSLTLTWEMTRELAETGRVTIGAHTVDHVRLPSTTRDEARRQMKLSKERIEQQIGRPVRHFAYPFGEFGRRESELARELGFMSAATACGANVFAEHAGHLHTLPRVYPPMRPAPRDAKAIASELELQLSGAMPAYVHHGRRVITHGGVSMLERAPQVSKPAGAGLEKEISIRLVALDDLERFSETFERCFGVSVGRRYFDWKYRQNPVGEVIAFEALHRDRTIAWYGLIPEIYRVHGRDQRIFQSMDTMTHPEYQRRGLFQTLAKKTFAHVLARDGRLDVIGVPGRNSHGGFVKRLGFRDLLRVRSFFLPRALHRVMRWTRSSRAIEFRDVRELTPALTRFLDDAKAPTRPVIQALTPELFDWRVFRNPLRRFQVVELHDGKDLVGVCVFEIDSRNRAFLFYSAFAQGVDPRESIPSLVDHLFDSTRVSMLLTWEPMNATLRSAYAACGFVVNPWNRGPMSARQPIIVRSEGALVNGASWFDAESFDLQPIMQD